MKYNIKVTLHVENHLYTEVTSIHIHGMHFRDNVWMDGAADITQVLIL